MAYVDLKHADDRLLAEMPVNVADIRAVNVAEIQIMNMPFWHQMGQEFLEAARATGLMSVCALSERQQQHDNRPKGLLWGARMATEKSPASAKASCLVYDRPCPTMAQSLAEHACRVMKVMMRGEGGGGAKGDLCGVCQDGDLHVPKAAL